MLSHKPTDAAAEREATDTGRGNHAPGSRETMELRFPVESVPCESALSAGSSDFGINMHSLHRREVYHYATVYCRTASDVVTSSAHSDFEVPLARQSYRIDDVSRTAALRDDSRSLVDQAVVDSSGGLVGWVGWLK
ncbi:MAG TPA: hypothetical protein VGC82_17140, partial [Rhodopila sp.]